MNDVAGTAARYVLDLAYDGENVSGWVERAGQSRAFFSGWLELLSLLEGPGLSRAENGSQRDIC